MPDIRGDFNSPFSIGGKFKDGRAAYLDYSATSNSTGSQCVGGCDYEGEKKVLSTALTCRKIDPL